MGNPAVNRSSAFDRVSVFFATGFYVSMLPARVLERFKDKNRTRSLIGKKWTGAGFFGSVEGALTYLLLPSALANAWWTLALGTAFAVVVGGRAEKALNNHDDPRIVIDEWIGCWIALWGSVYAGLPWVLVAFGLFRFFDVFKGPIGRRLQNLPGGWGVVSDDVYAGIAANVFTSLLRHFNTFSSGSGL